MSTSSLQTAIYTNELRDETLTNQLVDNSMDLDLAHKYSDNDIQRIHDQYAPEKEFIQNEMNSLDKTEQNDEYQDLLTELKELKDEEDKEVEQVENKINDYETKMQMENTLLESQLEEVNATKESFEEMLKQNIEQEFGYFQ